MLLFAAACSSSNPTAPSATPSAPLTGQAADESPGRAQDEPAPVPAAGFSPSPPAATSGPLGATSFVALGDSITWGTLSSFDGTFLFDAGPTFSYPFQLQSALNASHGPQIFSVENRGIGGESVVSGAQRINSVLSSVRPQGLLLLEGINDLNNGSSIGSIVGQLEIILDVARLHNVTVFIANMFQTYETVSPAPENRVRTNSATQITAFNSAIAQMASGRQNVYLVDLYHAFGSNRSFVGGDGLHPTAEGYERMSLWFRATIEQAFAVRSAFQ
jgi:lysophospholipase L1-like esterase